MSFFIIGALWCIAILWFLNSFVSAFIIATGREDGDRFIPAFIWGFILAQIPVIHQMAVYATVTVGIKMQEEEKTEG